MIRHAYLTLGFTALLPLTAMAQDKVENLEKRKETPRAERIDGIVSILAPAGLLFASFDTNGDYVIRDTEFSDGAALAFSRADGDKSGGLSLIELQKWREMVLGSLDAQPGNGSFDSNFDSLVTLSEFQDALGFEYERSDKNGDGVVNFAEMLRVRDMSQRRSRGGGERPERGNRGGDRPRR